MPKDGIERYIKQGDVFFQTTPNWMRATDEFTKSMLGPERYRRQMPIGSMVRAGIPVTFSSDSVGVMERWDPFLNMFCAVQRKFDDGTTLVPPQSEGIAIEDAIRAYTINCAKQARADKEIGSITVGKSADFVVLTEDVLAIPVEKVKDVKVEKTFFRGKCIFTR